MKEDHFPISKRCYGEHGMKEYSKSNLAFYSYNISSLDLAYVYQASRYVGYLYITNGCLPNPWNILSVHLSNLLRTSRILRLNNVWSICMNLILVTSLVMITSTPTHEYKKHKL